MLKKPQDEWSLIVKQQAEISKQRDFEEKQRLQQEKERYRQYLEYQKNLHDQLKQDHLKQKESEAVLIKQQIKAFQEDEARKRQQQAELQKYLAEEYITQSSSIKTRQNLDHQSKLKEEQQQILLTKALLEQEKRKKLEFKEKLHQDDLEMLNNKTLIEKNKKIEAQYEQLTAIELMKRKKEQEEKKEQNYRDYYNKVKQNQELKQKLYSLQVGSKIQGRNEEINTWVNKNIEQYNQTIERKLNQERIIKQNTLENVKDTLKYQLEEKNRIEMLRLEEQKRLAEEVQRKVEENKRLEQEKNINRRLEQVNYRNHLSSQALEIADVRSSAYKLSPFEKKINKNYSLDSSGMKNNLSVGAQEILKPEIRGSSNYDTQADLLSLSANNNSLSTMQMKKYLLNPKVQSSIRPGGIFS